MFFCKHVLHSVQNLNNIIIRTKMTTTKQAIIVGCYLTKDQHKLTKNGEKIDQKVSGRLKDLINIAGPIKLKKLKSFYGLSEQFPLVTVVGIGPENAGYNEQEMIDEAQENVRIGVGAGCSALKDLDVKTIAVDSCGQPEASGEAASLAIFTFKELKTGKETKEKMTPEIVLLQDASDPKELEAWNRGIVKGNCQNVARRLMELPANILTPEQLTVEAKTLFAATPKVEVIIRDKAWIEKMKMGSFMSVSHGSALPPFFLEMHYKNGPAKEQAPVILVGKGITFDSGGISLKPSANMEDMRADMGGAACVIATIFGAAKLNLPINMIGLTPICENMPSGTATHPGDVVTAMNGKTIQVDNTDAEGRLILADALIYAHQFNPKVIIDMATLTGAMIISLGSAATGVFSNSTPFWKVLLEAGKHTGDRVWRMPVFSHYAKGVTETHLADINNQGSHGNAGKSCTSAAFLKEFITSENWLHLDIAGVMMCKEEIPTYLTKGMSGRPTRTMIEYMKMLSQNPI